MFIYLSKKIAIPNKTKINAIAWNKQDNFIAVGGENGMLKVLKLDGGTEHNEKANKGLTAASNLSVNQTLEGHTEDIRVLVWNEHYKKLTTSDSNGVIVVWMMYKGSWYEEMINNRKKSTVAGMAWTADGLKICIIYEDGAVIVGSVDGNRIWGKELKNVQLSGVQWSPDGKLLLFSLRSGQVHLYDNQGNFVMRLDIQCVDLTNDVPIAGLDWYNGSYGTIHAFCPNLAVCYENGQVQLMCNESDLSPIVFNTDIIIVHCSWNHNGSLLAISGHQVLDNKSLNLVQFYNPFGHHLRTLKVPGQSISSCVWEGGSLRVVLAVDSFAYFANIRPDYKWCYFKNTIAYTMCKPHKPGISVTFWDIENHAIHTQHIPILLAIAAYGSYCVISTISDSVDETEGKYGLILCNTLGTSVDGIYVNMETSFVTMNNALVIAASKNNFVVWQYKTPKLTGVESTARAAPRMYHVDDNPLGTINILPDLDDTNRFPEVRTHNTLDPICCLACSNKCLLIGRESGQIQFYALPHVVLTTRYHVQARPHAIEINCNSTRISVIDITGVMTVLDISDGFGRSSTPEAPKLERKDVWAMRWASDNPQLLAIMEKTRMYIFKGVNPEEPIACSGYICSFNDLEVQAVLLDDIMESPLEKPSKECLVKLEVKSLRDTRMLLDRVGLVEADQFIEDNPHPRLWRLLAEAALKQSNLEVAEAAFIKANDYAKVLFVKSLAELKNPAVCKAKIAACFKRFDEAEKIFIEADRSDLALNLRQTLGDWFRVIQLLKNGANASDKVLKSAYNATADYFTHFNNWSAAVEYYELAKNNAQLVKCYYHLEDYSRLSKFTTTLPEGDPLLQKIGNIFAADAYCSEAVKAYVKFGDVKAAIDLCIKHNRWDTAIDLAKSYNVAKISDYFHKYTSHLVEQNKLLDAIDLNVQAKFYLQASELANSYARQVAKSGTLSLVDIKKHFVFAGKLTALHWKQPDSLAADSEALFNGWRGAEAYHLYMLTNDHLFNGKLHDALCASYKLQDYCDIIPLVEVYSLYALAACLSRSFQLCSRAFMKLKSDETGAKFRKLSQEIFMKNEPVDVRTNKAKCHKCSMEIADWNTFCPHCKTKFETCVASGKSIIHTNDVWICNECNHQALYNLVHFRNSCPLCHALNE